MEEKNWPMCLNSSILLFLTSLPTLPSRTCSEKYRTAPSHTHTNQQSMARRGLVGWERHNSAYAAEERNSYSCIEIEGVFFNKQEVAAGV